MKPSGGGGCSIKGKTLTSKLVNRSVTVVAQKEKGFIGDIAKFDFEPQNLIALSLPEKYGVFKEIYMENSLLIVKSAVEAAAAKIESDPKSHLIPLKRGADPEKFFEEKGKHMLLWRGIGNEETSQGLEFSWLRLLVFQPQEISHSLFLFKDKNLDPVLDLAQHYFGFALEISGSGLGEKEKETLLYLLLSKDIEVWKLFMRIHVLSVCEEPMKGEPAWLKIIAEIPAKQATQPPSLRGNFILKVTAEFLWRVRKEAAQYLYQKFRPFIETGKVELLGIEDIKII